MKEITILDKRFREMIPGSEINSRLDALAEQINRDYENKDVVFLGILNGAFLFAAELFKRINIKARISFVKLASYEGTKSSGSVKELIGWNEDIKGKPVVVIEDIVDTGHTLELVVGELKLRKVSERSQHFFTSRRHILKRSLSAMWDLRFLTILLSVSGSTMTDMDETFLQYIH